MITAKIRKECGFYYVPVYYDSDYVGGIWGDEYTVEPGITTEYDIKIFIDGDISGIMHVNDYVCLTWQEPKL